jgi:N utilization substance protein B
MRRHDARTMALSALFCWELTKDDPLAVFDQVAQGFFGAAGEAEAETAPLRPSQDKRFEYARDLFLCAVEGVPRIDPYIGRASQGWPVSRMPRVDLSILRLAVAEAMYLKATPIEVVIDEAVELCKEFSTHASPRFVNGVLMGIFREIGYVKDPREE